VKTILLIDHDLGVLFWLGRILDEAGFRAFPAKNCSDAETLLREYGLEVDLFVVNPALPDALGFVLALRRSDSKAKLVSLLGEDDEDAMLPNADGVYRKSVADEMQAVKWVALIQSVLGDVVH